MVNILFRTATGGRNSFVSADSPDFRRARLPGGNQAHTPRRLTTATGLVVAVLWAAFGEAANVSFTGNGGTSNTWNTDANWSTGTVPTSADVAVFDNAVTGSDSIVLGATNSIDGILVSRAQATTLSGSGGGSSGNRQINLGPAGITMDPGAGTFTIGIDVQGSRVTPAFAGSQTWTNNASNPLVAAAGGGSMTAPDGTQWTLTGTGGFFLDKPMTIAANGALIWNGTGTLTLNRTNANFTGTMTLNAGTVVVGNDLALGGVNGTGPVTIGPAVTLQSNSATRVVSNAVTLAGSLTLGGTNGMAIGPAGSVNLGGSNRTISVQGSTLSIQGIVSNGGIVKSGPGLLALAGANTYSGPTTVSAGSLAILGNQSAATGLLTVGNGAALAGTGTAGGDLSLAGGSSLVFGQTTLTVGGSTSFTGSFGIANLIGLDSTAADGSYQLLTGGINTANLLNVGPANAFDLGGGKQAYFTTDSGLGLAVVPEPSAAVLVAGLGFAAAAARRRGRRAANP
jgi:fibronectin-binding autotransporter adhesin